MEKVPLNDSEHEQGKTYIGQVQADCFCQVNILDRQSNPTILIKIRSSYLLICFAWPLQTHSMDGVLLSIWTRNKRHHRYSFANSYLELHIEINSENETLWQKRWFRFPIVNFPFMCNNISATRTYGVCYFRFLSSVFYQDFCDRRLLLINKYWTKCSWWLGWKDHFKSVTVVIMTRLIGIFMVPFQFNPGFKWWSWYPVLSFLCSIL
jgi:hypothetical protein